jgi:hypothetical protein
MFGPGVLADVHAKFISSIAGQGKHEGKSAVVKSGHTPVMLAVNWLNR